MPLAKKKIVSFNEFLKCPGVLVFWQFYSTPTPLLASPNQYLSVPFLNPNDHLSHLDHHSFSPLVEFRQESILDSLRNFSKSSSTTISDIRILHAQAVKTGLASCQQVGSVLLSFYVKFRHLVYARLLFEEISYRDVRVWTTVISGYAHVGLFGEALGLYRRMWIEGVLPNCFTLASVLKCSAGVNNLGFGKEIHGWILRHGIEFDVVLGNTVVDFYAKCGSFGYARSVFEMMGEKDIVSWNIMIGASLQMGYMDESMEFFNRLTFRDVASWNTIISGHMRNGFNTTALEFLYQMGRKGPKFNEFTYSLALGLVAALDLLELGRQCHAQLLRTGLESNTFIRTSLIDMYCKCTKVGIAASIFYTMRQDFTDLQGATIYNDGFMANSIFWNSMISGYVQNGRGGDAFELFCAMLSDGIDVCPFTLTSIASACSDVGTLEQGRQIHAFIEKCVPTSDVVLVSAIIDMYAKCGSIEDSLAIFYKTIGRNVVLWTSMIAGCAIHGRGREAIRLFEMMLMEKIKPNEVTYVGVLSACSHSGLVEEGYKYYKSMQEEYGILPGVEHLTCMVDLLGRANQLHEAKDFIFRNGVSHLSSVWSAFLSACRVHKNMDLGKQAAEQLVQLEPFGVGSYILLANICATTQKWEEAENVRDFMRNRGIKKVAGQSWIQLKNKVHTFVVGDRSHPNSAEIYSYLERLLARIKEVGYSTETNLVLHDVEEEQSEVLISYHSEKLAIAYGLMSTPGGLPIRVMKNLRVCVDCHSAIKYISQVTNRLVVLRDARRFHHFNDGQCSCGDYW